MAYGWVALHQFVPAAWIEDQVGGHFQFLTIQGLCISFATMLLSLAVGLLPSNAALLWAKRTLLMIALPLSFVISSIYWTLMLLFPHLILQLAEPTSADEAPAFMMIPLSTDLALHLAPVVALVVDFFLLEKKFTAKESAKAPIMVLIYGICYSCFVEYCTSKNGNWPYPFLNNPLPIRLAIYGVVMAMAFGAYRALNRLHS